MNEGRPPARTNGTRMTRTASSWPARAATTVPVCSFPVTRHTAARKMCPPSSGSAGSRLKTPTSRFAPRELEQEELGDGLIHRPGREIRKSARGQRHQRTRR